MKKIIVCISLIMLALTGCGGEDRSEQEIIIEYVKSNEKELVEILSKIDLEKELDQKDFISQLPKGLKMRNVYIANGSCVEFNTGIGIVTPSHYYGFYYTPLNKPLAAGIEDKRLKEDGEGYRIQETGKKDWYYTEKIVDNFYFYEDHY